MKKWFVSYLYEVNDKPRFNHCIIEEYPLKWIASMIKFNQDKNYGADRRYVLLSFAPIEAGALSQEEEELFED